MKRRYQRALLIFLGAATLVFLLVILLRPREPEYQGKRLSAWLEDLSRTPYPEKGSEQAAKAIREIGTNAVPFLVSKLKARDSTLKIRFVELVRKQNLFEFPFQSAGGRRTEACEALLILGAEAKGAIPELGKLLDHRDTAYSALIGLFAIGSNSIPILIEACDTTNQMIRPSVAFVLSKLSGGGSGPRVSSFNAPVSTEQVNVFGLSVDSTDAGRLISNLKDPHPAVRRATAEAMSEYFGTNAFPGGKAPLELVDSVKSVAAALAETLKDPDRSVREVVATTLKQIDLGAAPKAGVK